MGKPKKGLSDTVRKSQAAKSKNVFQVKNNPFEVKINKQKHKILGRKSKHDRGLPGVSRSKANKKRKDTLLKEYKERHKSNNLSDERFGEENVDMSVEEKMLKRFAMEKKRKHEKMSLFNLNDEDELTHFGRSLADINDFGATSISDNEDSGVISGEYVAEAHFGGGIFSKKSSDENMDEPKQKTRKEIMDEIILKSKKAKFERQNAQEQSIALREKLDNTWEEVEMLLKSSTRSKKDREEERDSYKNDAYDIAVRQMQYDKKAAPAPRGKTEAEKAVEEAARMWKLEDERIQRMHGSYSTTSTHRSADELNDGYVTEKITVEPVSYKDGVMVGSELPADDGDSANWQLEVDLDHENDNLEQEDAVSDQSGEDGNEDEESDDDDDDFSDILSEKEDDIMAENASDKDDDSGNVSLDTVIKSVVAKKTDDFPLSYDEFRTLVENKYQNDCIRCVSDLKEKYQPSAAEGNKDKMKLLFEYTWKTTCDQFNATMHSMTCVNGLISLLYNLCQLNITDCAKYIVTEMKETYHFHQRDEGRLSSLRLNELMRFKMMKVLFSTSDFFHPVCTPALLFMSNILKCHRPNGLRDLASGLFICTLIYEYVCFSKRFVPECINYLCAAMCFSVPKTVQKSKGLPASASWHITSKNCELLVLKSDCHACTKEPIEKPNLLMLLSTNRENSPNEDIVRLQLQQVTLRLVLKFILIYGNLPCFKEIFDPIRVTCTRCAIGLKQQHSQAEVHPHANLLSEVQGEIQRIIKRRPSVTPLVQIEKNRPTALPLYEPRIETVGEPFRKGNNKKVSASKQQRERLQHKYKRELKGAVREIKKDARFIAREQLNEQIEKDQERAEKVKRLFGLLSNQEGDVKNINRKKFKIDLS